MPDIYLKKHQTWLVPADEHAEEILSKMKSGQVMKIRYSLPRNYANHKRFFAFLKVGFEIQDNFTNKEHFRKWIQMKSGQWESVTVPNGNVLFMPKSIAFDKMEEDEFQRMFSDCLDVFIEHWGDRITKDQLEAIVEFA